MRWVRASIGITTREWLRYIRQHGRLLAAIVRPMIWLAVFSVGFRSALGLSITPPYQTYVLYEVYLVPGLAGMMLLFHGMQASLSMVYDREMGSMRVLLTNPLPRWFLLCARLLATTLVVTPMVEAFLLIARFWGVRPPWGGYLAALPALLLSGLMLGAFGLLISSMVRQLENFAGVMNFVIFPMFFASSALYPLWRVQEGSPWLATVCRLNPFTYSVELIRFAFYQQVNWLALAVVAGCTAAFLGGAVIAYDPARGMLMRRGG
jgi:ABC-2 type transport system permease protein